MSFIKKSDINKIPNKLMKFLIGPWNSESSFEFAVGELESGAKSAYHYHEKVEEVLYIIEGKLDVIIEGKITEMSSGTAVHIKPGLKHGIEVKEPTNLIEVKNPSDESDKHVVQ